MKPYNSVFPPRRSWRKSGAWEWGVWGSSLVQRLKNPNICIPIWLLTELLISLCVYVMSRNISGSVGDLGINQGSGCFLDKFRGPAWTPVQNISFLFIPLSEIHLLAIKIQKCYCLLYKKIRKLSCFISFLPFPFLSYSSLPQCVMICCKNGTRRGPRGRVGWEDEAGCFLGTNLVRILQFTWHPWLTLTESCFSVVAVCWDGVRLCLLLWKQSGLLEVWGGRQYWVQQRLLRGSNPALRWRWPDHPLWQWVCLCLSLLKTQEPLGQGNKPAPHFFPSIILFTWWYLLSTYCRPGTDQALPYSAEQDSAPVLKGRHSFNK